MLSEHWLPSEIWDKATPDGRIPTKPATRHDLPPRAAAAVYAAFVAVLAQFALGIATLLLVVPVALGALHQAGALTLAGILTWLVFETRPRVPHA